MLESIARLAEQLLGDGQVDRRRVGLDVAEKCRQVKETLAWIESLAIPPQESPDGERVSQIVDPGRARAVSRSKLEFRD